MLIVKFFQTVVPILMCVRLVNGYSTYTYVQNDFFTRGCKTEEIRGCNYTKFFPLTTLRNSSDFWLPFYVKIKEDAYVLLSQTPFVQPKSKSTATYEIVFEANRNNFTTIRRTRRGSDERCIQRKNELSSDEWRRFSIRITLMGEFSIEGPENCSDFLTWDDQRPMLMEYFSFSSYLNASGTSAFNCTTQSDLEWYLFVRSNYNRRIAPKNLTTIPFTITSRNVDLDESRGIFKLNGTTEMTWEDDRLIWEPNSFSQLNNFTIENQFITWTPNAELTHYYAQIFGDGDTSLWNNGTVTWTPSVRIKTKYNHRDAKLWPFDSQTCQINFTTIAELNFSMNFEQDEYSKVTPMWTIKEIRVRSVTRNETKSSNYRRHWSVEITVKRNISSQHYFLMVQFIIYGLAWVLSLFVTTTCSLKLMINFTLLLMIAFTNLILMDIMPQFPQKIPLFFIPYATLFVFCALSNCYSVLSLYFCKGQEKKNANRESNENGEIHTNEEVTRAENNQ